MYSGGTECASKSVGNARGQTNLREGGGPPVWAPDMMGRTVRSGGPRRLPKGGATVETGLERKQWCRVGMYCMLDAIMLHFALHYMFTKAAEGPQHRFGPLYVHSFGNNKKTNP